MVKFVKSLYGMEIIKAETKNKDYKLSDQGLCLILKTNGTKYFRFYLWL